MSSGMQSTEDEKILEEAFDMFDKDGNKTICTTEFASVIRALGFNPTDAEIAKTIKELDKNGSGKLEFNEFRDWYRTAKTPRKSTVDELYQAFKCFDKNNNGFIEAGELKKILNTMGQHISDREIQDMIEAADMDSDGKINYKEFAEFICSTPGSKPSKNNSKSSPKKSEKS